MRFDQAFNQRTVEQKGFCEGLIDSGDADKAALNWQMGDMSLKEDIENIDFGLENKANHSNSFINSIL